MENHICKVCSQTFPTGRTLGVHMKTHVVLSSLMDDKDKSVSMYGLRDNPKKSRRFDDMCMEKEKDEVPSKRVKVCSLNSSSFKMAIDELKHVKDNDLWIRESYDEQAKEMPSQSNRKFSFMSMPVSKRRRTPRKVMKFSVYSAQSAPSSEYTNEEMNGAVCLLMLSRGTRSITDVIDEIPPIIKRGKKVHSYPFEDEDQPFKKLKVSCLNKNFDLGHITSHVEDVGKGSSSNQYDCESVIQKSCMRNKYACTTCHKSFPSHQALGGHCTSHKMKKGASKKFNNQDSDLQTIGKSSENFQSYACSICGKAYPTGQALGGHRRSHFVKGNNDSYGIHSQPTRMKLGQKVSKPNSIDVDLPTPDNDY